MKRALGAVAFVALLAAPAAAAEGLSVRIREAALDPHGEVRIIASVAGPETGSPRFTVTEEGREVRDVKAEPLLGSGARSVAVVLAVDVSGSTRGRPLDDARAAAGTFLDRLPGSVRVALVAFGSRPQLVLDFTTDHGAVRTALASLRAGGETALYDGVAFAVQALGRTDAQRNLVVFSDGKDTASTASLSAAVDAATQAKASVGVVALQGPELDPISLEALATRTGGRVFPAGGGVQLAQAFEQAAAAITSQYVLSYSARAEGPKELDLAVSVRAGDAQARDAVVVLNPRVPRPAPVRPGDGLGLPGALGTGAKGAGVLALFGALALMAFHLLPRRAAAWNDVVAFHAGGGRAPDARKASPSRAALAQGVVALLARVPKPAGYEDALQLLLDRAAWPLRASEFIAIRAAAAGGGLLLGWAVAGTPVIGLALAVAGWVAPRLVLKRRVDKRAATFLAQLPDTLQLLAASLEAGYGLLQGVDTIVRESSPPTSTEFGRVLSEIRLGMPAHDALSAMAERLGVEDFRWVVLAMNVQREVGGNLAALLKTVADTLREREALRRSVKVLSAEGRLSAWVLTMLPIGLAVYMALVNPTYISLLTTSGAGRVMVAFAVGLMGVGAAWLRRIIRIEV